MDNKKGVIIMLLVLVGTIIFYLTKLGGNSFLLFTDILVAVYSVVAVVVGVIAIRTFSLKSLQGKALLFMVVGIVFWSLPEILWLIFSQPARYYLETLRFLGYIPLTIGFFTVAKITDPTLRKKRKKITYLFLIFLIASIVYLNVLPIVFGQTSVINSIVNSGYIVADFVLLFGIILLLRTVFAFRKGFLSLSWLITAIAFVGTFIFDIYFAINYATYTQGHPIEIFWLATYILLAFGFYHQKLSMDKVIRNGLGGKFDEKKKK